MDFLDELQQRPLVADGGMGTELLAAGIAPERCLEELNLSEPELVRALHERAIAVGARVIETNTFGANRVRLAATGHAHRVNEINWSAAQLAKEAAKGSGVFVAGSVGPLGMTAAEAAARGIDRHAVYLEQIGALLDGGCQLIILETFLEPDELLIALNAKHSLHHCPVVTLLACADPAQFWPAAERLRAADADVVGVNCVSTTAALAIFEKPEGPGPFAAFPSAGLPEEVAGSLRYPTTPAEFANAGVALADRGVSLLGGCCGVRPTHLAALARALAPAIPAS